METQICPFPIFSCYLKLHSGTVLTLVTDYHIICLAGFSYLDSQKTECSKFNLFKSHYLMSCQQESYKAAGHSQDAVIIQSWKFQSTDSSNERHLYFLPLNTSTLNSRDTCTRLFSLWLSVFWSLLYSSTLSHSVLWLLVWASLWDSLRHKAAVKTTFY